MIVQYYSANVCRGVSCFQHEYDVGCLKIYGSLIWVE